MLDVTVELEAPDPYEPAAWLGVDLGWWTSPRLGWQPRRRRPREQSASPSPSRARPAAGQAHPLRPPPAEAPLGARAPFRHRRQSHDREAACTPGNAPAAGSPSRTSKVSATGSGLEGRSAAALHSWAFAQLGELIAYKAQLAGVPVDADIDPRNTSRQCPCCGHNSKPNRPSQARFRCVECGHRGHADYIAACNIAGRAAVNRPNVPNVLSSLSIARRTSPRLQPWVVDPGPHTRRRGRAGSHSGGSAQTTACAVVRRTGRAGRGTCRGSGPRSAPRAAASFCA